MKLQYKLDSNDYWELSKKARMYSPQIKTTRFWLYTILICGTFLLSLGQTLLYSVVRTFIWSALVFPTVERSLYYIRDKVRVNSNFLGDRSLILKETGVELVSLSKRQFFDWKHYIQVVEDINYFFLFDKEGKCIQIPKKGQGDVTIEELRNILKQNIETFTAHNPSYIREVIPRIQVIILILVLILTSINKLDWNDSDDPLSSSREAIYGLFLGVSTEDSVETLKKEGLKLRTGVTLDDINQLYEQLNNYPNTNEIFINRFPLYTLLDEAEKLYYERELPKEQTTGIFSGESEHWRIVNYTVKATPALFRTFEGRMYMKGQEMYQAAHFQKEFFIVFKGKGPIPLHDYVIAEANPEVKPEELEISEEPTGEYYGEHESYKNIQGDPVSIQDIEEVYAIVQWRGKDEEKMHEEKVTLQLNES
ncbi:YcxB family protein [Litchfieldia salsa]|uniref:Uncharacterized protein n=1 Tax=Litchfieldia salsa TaxID=930152 RepID=A0A1H0WZZ5_9BACI|nr:YcxB family protein [Litchfieldia salsa]SDP96314.1 hypothetical protein SAMN05216565_12119 [Litchfieldia salsa]